MTGTEPLGATPAGGATRFVVASGVAERIELCLDGPDGGAGDRVDLVPGDDGLWRAEVAGVGPGHRYGYRVHGPGDPAAGHACDPAKLLVDPAARRVTGDLRWCPELTAPGVDSAPLVPRSVVVEPPRPVPAEDRPATTWDRTVVYEAHVGHLTARHPLVPAGDRGRYPGLAAPAVVDHLRRLGVTAVELLPVQHFVSESFLVAAGDRNVWGYNPLAWGAPHAGYATAGGDPVVELRDAVATLHRAGIEVWLDVVVNHTCEGSLGTGPILSWRGFDNAATYRLLPGPGGLLDDDVTGCGNAVDTRSLLVRRLVRECLARWVTEIGIDGFRFDLAATLVRGDDGPTAASAFLTEVTGDPVFDGVKLVAEPWDVGAGGYALGRFPAPWREWNDRFRDDTRDLWRGRATRAVASRRLAGSADVLRDGAGPIGAGRRDATASINAVTTHDGFTLADLVSHDRPVDEGHDQRSWSGGREGPTADPTVLAGRRRRQRCLLGTLAVAQGVPLLLAGDELGRSQGGRANGYTLDEREWSTAWVDADWDLVAWTAAAFALRDRRPLLRRADWVDPGDPALRWADADGADLAPEDWDDPGARSLRVHLVADPDRGEEPGEVVLLVAAGEGPVTFTLPAGRWTVALDAAWVRPPAHADRPTAAGTLAVDAPTLVVLDRP